MPSLNNDKTTTQGRRCADIDTQVDKHSVGETATRTGDKNDGGGANVRKGHQETDTSFVERGLSDPPSDNASAANALGRTATTPPMSVPTHAQKGPKPGCMVCSNNVWGRHGFHVVCKRSRPTELPSHCVVPELPGG